MSSPNHEIKPWGEYLVLMDSPTCKVKRLEVLPGKRLSYQRHQKRSEHWFVVHGRARVTLDGKDVEYGPGQAIDIPARTAHRVECVGAERLVFIEVQTGTYFGEDDIERLADDFGRA